MTEIHRTDHRVLRRRIGNGMVASQIGATTSSGWDQTAAAQTPPPWYAAAATRHAVIGSANPLSTMKQPASGIGGARIGTVGMLDPAMKTVGYLKMGGGYGVALVLLHHRPAPEGECMY